MDEKGYVSGEVIGCAPPSHIGDLYTCPSMYRRRKENVFSCGVLKRSMRSMTIDTAPSYNIANTPTCHTLVALHFYMSSPQSSLVFF